MRRWLMIGLAALLFAAGGVSSSSASDTCGARAVAFLEGPVEVGFLAGRHGATRRACPRTEMALGAGGQIIAEPDNFYGNVTLGGRLEGSWAIDRRLEIFGSVELVRYQTVISALTADHLGLGHTSIGATWQLVPDSPSGTWALTSGLTLPTALGLYRHALPFAWDGGVTWAHRFRPELGVHGYLGALASLAISAGASDPRIGLLFNAGGSYRPAESFALVVDVDVATFYASTLDHLAVGVGLRFMPDARGIELLLKTPLIGRERSLVTGLLRLTYDFDFDALDRPARHPE